jgi:Spy/CpxP family protein refolding chaperone
MMLCLTLSLPVLAQGQGRGGRGRGGFGGGFMFGSAQLLGIEQVQKELKITEEQRGKLMALREEGGRPDFGRFRDLSEEEREKAFAEMREKADAQNKKAEALLDAGQLARLKQISLQVRGNAAIADDAVAKDLGLSEEQVAQAKAIGEETSKQMRDLRRGARSEDREAMRKKREELQKNADEEYLAILTDEQKTKLTNLKGPEFKLDQSALRRGPGRGERRRGGNNS